MIKKIEWYSPNNKYKILARLFDDKSYHVTCFTFSNGRFSIFPKRKLPKYVLDKMSELESELIKHE